MLLVLQLHLVMMRKYAKFGVDTLNTFEKWAKFILKFLHNNYDNLAITTVTLFLRNRQAKNVFHKYSFSCI